ncbi:hypothetical protein ACFL35_04565 [Candidatus Riflebacteria bacterium]
MRRTGLIPIILSLILLSACFENENRSTLARKLLENLKTEASLQSIIEIKKVGFLVIGQVFKGETLARSVLVHADTGFSNGKILLHTPGEIRKVMQKGRFLAVPIKFFPGPFQEFKVFDLKTENWVFQGKDLKNLYYYEKEEKIILEFEVSPIIQGDNKLLGTRVIEFKPALKISASKFSAIKTPGAALNAVEYLWRKKNFKRALRLWKKYRAKYFHSKQSSELSEHAKRLDKILTGHKSNYAGEKSQR